MNYPIDFTKAFIQGCIADISPLNITPAAETCGCVNFLFQKEIPFEMLMKLSKTDFTELFVLFLNVCQSVI